jgi:hypothetical protein
MMGFVGRSDGSFLVGTPGGGARDRVVHQPFLMARAHSRIAAALDLKPAIGVIPDAFDMTLAGADPAGFVYRCLDNAAIDIANRYEDRVVNTSTQMADLTRIVPGARVRGNIERWATTRVSLRGGRIEDSAAHPDAGRIWSFGQYRQRLTDAVEYRAEAGAELRLVAGDEVRTYALSEGADELWVVSASLPQGTSTPTRLEHSHVAFDFLAEARPIVAECAEAVGREVPATELPCAHGVSARVGFGAGVRAFPPYSELCFLVVIIRGGSA